MVEKRKKMLTEFLTLLLALETTDYPGLYEQIFTFLSPGWEAQRSNVVVQAVTAVSQVTVETSHWSGSLQILGSHWWTQGWCQGLNMPYCHNTLLKGS